MIIAELIKHLERFPQDARVVCTSEVFAKGNIGTIFFSGPAKDDENFVVLEQIEG